MRGARRKLLKSKPLTPNPLSHKEMKKKTIKAWAIVNKDFEANIEQHPSLSSADLFFTEGQAKQELENRFPKFCGECGRKAKPLERHIVIRAVEIKILPSKKTPPPRATKTKKK